MNPPDAVMAGFPGVHQWDRLQPHVWRGYDWPADTFRFVAAYPPHIAILSVGTAAMRELERHALVHAEVIEPLLTNLNARRWGCTS